MLLMTKCEKMANVSYFRRHIELTRAAKTHRQMSKISAIVYLENCLASVDLAAADATAQLPSSTRLAQGYFTFMFCSFIISMPCPGQKHQYTVDTVDNLHE